MFESFSVSSLFCCGLCVYFMPGLSCFNYYSFEEFETWMLSTVFLIKIALANQDLLWLYVQLGVGLLYTHVENTIGFEKIVFSLDGFDI